MILKNLHNHLIIIKSLNIIMETFVIIIIERQIATANFVTITTNLTQVMLEKRPIKAYYCHLIN